LACLSLCLGDSQKGAFWNIAVRLKEKIGFFAPTGLRHKAQGSGVAATLGYDPESRWDSRMTAPKSLAVFALDYGFQTVDFSS
jgi:hypothetical protein